MAVDTDMAKLLLEDRDFRFKVAFLAIRVADTVLKEANSVSDHDERAAYANKLLNNIELEAERVRRVIVATASSIPSNVTDTQIESVITSSWNTLAGIFVPETP